VSRTEDVYGDADEVEHDCRHVEHGVGPVSPAGGKSVEVAENFLGPQIDSAFARVPVRQFDDCDALWPEKQDKRNNPEPDRDATVGSDGGDHVQIEDGDYKEED